jgi:hypothetical protein
MRYSCEVCGERFFVHGHMKRHLYSHTGIKPHCCRFAALVIMLLVIGGTNTCVI